MNDEQRQLARDLGALAARLTSGEPVFGPDAKEGDEVVLDDGTRVVLAEDPDPDQWTVRAKVTLPPALAERIADSSRYGPPPQARTGGEVLTEDDGPPPEWWKVVRRARP